MNDQTLSLRDIHLPDPISWWPPAPGWWIVLGLFLTLMVAVWVFVRWKASRRFRYLALEHLEQLAIDFQKHQDNHKFTQNISVLLKRVCLVCFPRSQVAGLTGEEWLYFLDQNLPEKPFSEGPGRALLLAPYQRQGDAVDVEGVLRVCRLWLKNAKKQK